MNADTFENEMRGGTRAASTKISDEDVDYVVTLVEGNCQITLKENTAKLITDRNVRVHPTTVGRHIQNRLFSLKMVRHEPASCNSDVNKGYRAEYCLRILQLTATKTVLYQDESNLNLFCQRSMGRAVQGRRASRILPNCRGPNVHMMINCKYWQSLNGVEEVSSKKTTETGL